MRTPAPTSTPSAAPAAGATGRRRCLRPTATALGLALAVSLAPSAPVWAAPTPGTTSESATADKKAVDSALHALQEDLVGTSDELTSAYAEDAAVQEQRPGAQRAADLAARVQAEAQAAADDLAQRLTASQTAMTAARESVAETEQAMADSHTSLGRIAASAYRSSRTPQGLAIAMGSTSPDEFASRSAAVSGLSEAEADALAELSTDEAVRRSATTRLTAVAEQVEALRAEAEQQLDVATQAAEDAAARKAEVEALAARQQAAVSTIESRQAEEEARLAELQRESDELGDQLREIAEVEARRDAERRAAEEAARAASSGAGSSSSSADRLSSPPAVSRSTRADTGGTLLRPAGRISSPFGMRMHPIKGIMRMHNGQDFAAGCGTPVLAAEDGEIVSAGYNGSYGNITVINHGTLRGQQVATAYAHMQSFTKRSGSVQRGEVIGYEGTTGGSTGCHVHFEVRVSGSPVNPMNWV